MLKDLAKWIPLLTYPQNYWFQDGRGLATATIGKANRELWQSRQAVVAIALLKLIACARNLLPKAKVVSLPWRNIFSGVSLWFSKRK